MPAKKKTLGFKPKSLTLEQIQQEYSDLNADVGQLSLKIRNTQKMIDDAVIEMDKKMDRMNELAKIGSALKVVPEPPKEPLPIIPPQVETEPKPAAVSA